MHARICKNLIVNFNYIYTDALKSLKYQELCELSVDKHA
jgi:hypothetical protein